MDHIIFQENYLPEDRKARGLLLSNSISFNVTLASIKKYSKWGVINNKKEIDAVQKYCNRLEIKTPSLKKEVQYLSGGNQQKVVVSKWLSADGEIIIFDEPTRGIDVGTKSEIQKMAVALAKSKGMAVIFISSEMDEMVRTCSKIIVIRDRKKVAEIEGDKISSDNIMKAIAGGEV